MHHRKHPDAPDEQRQPDQPDQPEKVSPEEAAASYDRWFRQKVEASLADKRPGIPHEDVMEQMRVLIESRAKHQKR